MTRQALSFLALFALSGCAGNSPVQRIELQSGDFGVAELAEIGAVDPIILQNNIVRFNIAFGEFAVTVLGETAPVATEL